MLGRTLSRALILVVVLTGVAIVPACLWQRHRAVGQIERVSERFVRSASKLDIAALRDCLTEPGRASIPGYYACVASRKLAELNRDVEISVRVEATDVLMQRGVATVKVKREVAEHGRRLGKPVNTRIRDECTVICAYDGAQWLVDLDRTLERGQDSAAKITLFRECRVK